MLNGQLTPAINAGGGGLWYRNPAWGWRDSSADGVSFDGTTFRTGTITSSGPFTVSDTTASTSTGTGCGTFAGGVGVNGALNVGGTLQVASTGTVTLTDAGTNTLPTVLTIVHKSSGTPAAAFGTTLTLAAATNGNAQRNLFDFSAIWVDATDGTRKSRALLYAYDTTTREAVRIESSGSAPMIGFLGANASIRNAITGSRSANAALASLLTELANKGLITDSTTV